MGKLLDLRTKEYTLQPTNLYSRNFGIWCIAQAKILSIFQSEGWVNSYRNMIMPNCRGHIFYISTIHWPLRPTTSYQFLFVFSEKHQRRTEGKISFDKIRDKFPYNNKKKSSVTKTSTKTIYCFSVKTELSVSHCRIHSLYFSNKVSL